MMNSASLVSHLECSLTGARYEPNQIRNLSDAGKPLLVRYDLSSLTPSWQEVVEQRPNDLWRYRELLPYRDSSSIVSLGEGATPLIPLNKCVEGSNVWVKDESSLPTGSFKARGIAMAVTMAKEFGIDKIAMPTNGNAGSALAAYCAASNIKTSIYCPADTPSINIQEMQIYGADVHCIDGLIDDCGKLVAKLVQEEGWFDMSTLKEPYRLEGKKTMGFELVEQLEWQVPDAILYPTGGGTGLIGMWKAFDELEEIGLIGRKRPKMFAVQAEGCAPIVRAFEQGDEFASRWENSATIASGIRVPAAVGDFLILKAVRESQGKALAVSDEEILECREKCARKDGLLLCPEGAATLAAYRKALDQRDVLDSDRVILFNCASGLKYPLR